MTTTTAASGTDSGGGAEPEMITYTGEGVGRASR